LDAAFDSRQIADLLNAMSKLIVFAAVKDGLSRILKNNYYPINYGYDMNIKSQSGLNKMNAKYARTQP
jgi:hypothetical protein